AELDKSAQRAADRAELVGNLGAQERDRGDAEDGDQGHQKGVLDQRRALFLLAEELADLLDELRHRTDSCNGSEGEGTNHRIPHARRWATRQEFWLFGMRASSRSGGGQSNGDASEV